VGTKQSTRFPLVLTFTGGDSQRCWTVPSVSFSDGLGCTTDAPQMHHNRADHCHRLVNSLSYFHPLCCPTGHEAFQEGMARPDMTRMIECLNDGVWAGECYRLAAPKKGLIP
jgi:hypothetical protein